MHTTFRCILPNHPPHRHRDFSSNGQFFQALQESLKGRMFATEATDMTNENIAAPWSQWGSDVAPDAVRQMEGACSLPVSRAGALMPDAHIGYGLPIGGVLATENCVIPYAVGVDIACRMKMSVLDLPTDVLCKDERNLVRAIEEETRFGLGAAFKHPRDHEVMDEDWSFSVVTRESKDKAREQLGTSGTGNHFVEFGIFTIRHDLLGIPPGDYLALLSHSGSRGTGARVCQHYSRLAMDRLRRLPPELKHLAWLSLDSDEGREYWAAMELMGRYASANHALIHKHIAQYLNAGVLLDIENAHNFAWKERHVVGGVERELVIHRKGATPADAGVPGIIPGSMASPCFIVRGKGNAASLRSAAHGAGRLMSRTKARKSITWSALRKHLENCGVKLISAGLDEAPMVYKDINSVMTAQADLVEVQGCFNPRIVKMCPGNERAED